TGEHAERRGGRRGGGTPGGTRRGQGDGEEPHATPADDEHRRAGRHAEHLEARETAGGGLGQRGGDGIEATGQGMHAARREPDALGEAADTDAAWALADAHCVALGTLTATVRGIAGDHVPDEAADADTADIVYTA